MLLFCTMCAMVGAAAAQQPRLPGTLVYLADVAPGIVQDMRYAQADNFTGRPVAGYAAAECILLRAAAEALGAVQADLKPRGYALKVYDCYRPIRAVRAFVEWSERKEDPATRRFHPLLRRSELFARGYIARASSHSRGAAIDLTIVRLPQPVVDAFDPARRYGDCTGPVEQRAPDSSVDMGTGFDCFDARSHTFANALTPEQTASRRLLVEAMQRRGFRNYAREWWHFTHSASEGGPSFDVPIEPRGGTAKAP
jgi:D-alanyl-D-alanine dipeptidase